MDIYLLAQNDTWRFDTSVTDQYRITVTCDDGKTGGTTTATTLISLLSNQAPVISNVPRTFKLVAEQPANASCPGFQPLTVFFSSDEMNYKINEIHVKTHVSIVCMVMPNFNSALKVYILFYII